MAVARNLSDEIEQLAAKRHTAWAEGDNATATRIEKQLDALYEEKRMAKALHGTPKAREQAKKRAEVERELERLMQG